MFNLEFSGQFKKDYKQMKKRGADMSLINHLIEQLEEKGQVPMSNKPHLLVGNYKGIWECHVAPDWLLLYDKTDSIKLIRLIRTGTHSDIFKK